MMNATRGEAIMHHQFSEYRQIEGEMGSRPNGVLISQETGKTVGYALWKLQERADLFVNPGEDVYEGMIVGENARDNDMTVNPVREKKLTNIRSAGAEDAMLLRPPREITLELALEYIEWDEYVEITPQVIRLRKICLTETERKRQFRGRPA
jgi:GTP-binding protein